MQPETEYNCSAAGFGRRLKMTVSLCAVSRTAGRLFVVLADDADEDERTYRQLIAQACAVRLPRTRVGKVDFMRLRQEPSRPDPY